MPGVGEVIALTYLLTAAESNRLAKSGGLDTYCGLAPGRHQSGARDPPWRITEGGGNGVRRLLVQCGHVLLRPNGPDTECHGQMPAAPGAKLAKHPAAITVARRHAGRLQPRWTTGEVYGPHRQASRMSTSAAA